MNKGFSTKYVCSDESGLQILRSFTGKLIPGRPFSIDESEKIAIAGGFQSLTPDTSFFLSPTLQLNSDLGDFSDQELLALAKAELKRFQAIKYRNYQVDVDPRVCVISKDAAALDTFIDTYGGALEIQPLLLNGSSPDYTLVTELHFESADAGCRLRYRKRSPVKQQNCTYCGECGAACPENCISPQLYVDYNRCTFCKECEKVCADNAMDIYGVEEIEFSVPAVIMLGQTGIEVPENSTFIFQENQIPDFFKTIYTAEIKEVVCHNNSICQYSSKLETGCARCVDSCPHGALSKGPGGIVIDHVECQECGNCMAVCPTGAMQNGDFNDAVLIQYLQSLDLEHDLDIVIGEEKQLHELWWRKNGDDSRKSFYLEYSNLASLSFFHLMLFFASGFRSARLLVEDPAQWSRSLQPHIAAANRIIGSLYDVDFVQLTGVDEYLAESGVGVSSPLVSKIKLEGYDNRRAVLSHILQRLLADSEKILTAEQAGGYFSAIKCAANNCTHCLACLNECKMRALEADQETLSLTYQAGLCVGCGVCVTVCPENVLSRNEDFQLDKEFFNRQVFVQAEPVKCKECGKVFGTRKSLDRVMQILSARESVNTDHFEYCSTCRVVKLFEIEGA